MTIAPAPNLFYRPVHGGNLNEIAAAFGVVPDELIDFSSNINPAGPPAGVRAYLSRFAADPKVVSRYPESDCRSLCATIANHLKLGEPQSIVVANGSAALLDIALRGLRRKRCLLPIPAFSEYDRALKAADVTCIFFQLRPEDDFQLDVDAFVRTSERQNCDIWIITNPHNPSGSVLDMHTVLRLVELAQDRNVIVLLDEAFVDYCPEFSVSQVAIKSRHLVVLRSLTKFYGLAGLRAGFVVAHADHVDRLRLQLPSWPLSSLAIAAAIEALADLTYGEQTRSTCSSERHWFSHQLRTLCMRVFPSVANFLLLELPPKCPPAALLQKLLITRYRIVVRDCSSYQGLAGGKYIRVAILNRRENGKLISALKEVLTS